MRKLFIKWMRGWCTERGETYQSRRSYQIKAHTSRLCAQQKHIYDASDKCFQVRSPTSMTPHLGFL